MLPNGPFQPIHFKPDIPKDTLNRLHDHAEHHQEDEVGVINMTAQERLQQEQQEKESYRQSRQKQEKEIEEYRQNARFAQTDYSSFDSEIVDRPVETYYCSHCGNYILVMECRLRDCAKRKADESLCIDINNQVCKCPGMIVDGPMKVLQRDNDKLELQYIMPCQQCSLPIAYRHHKNIGQCKRIFVLNDAISNDPTALQKKIKELKQSLALVKGFK